MNPVFRDNLLAGPIMPCVIIDNGLLVNTMTLICPCCSEKVYENVTVVHHHTFYNWGTQAMWYSQILSMEVHRCREEQDWNIAELTREFVSDSHD